MNFDTALSRRDFACLASSAGAAFLAGKLSAGLLPIRRAGGPRLKLAINAYSFSKLLNDHNKGRGQGMSLLDLIDFCARQNVDAVDVTGYFFSTYPNVPDESEINAIKRHAFECGIDISGTGVRNNFTTADKTVRDASVRHIKEWIEVAARLGAPEAMSSSRRVMFAVIILGSHTMLRSAEPNGEDYRPHTPTLVFHLAHADDAGDTEVIRGSVQMLSSVSKVVFASGAVQVRFDSHVVSYHQVAKAIADAGAARGKSFDPTLKFIIPDYTKADNAAKVDAVLKGKRLNQRVRIETLNKARGEFLLHFLPLTIDDADPKPQGFNGGHLNHPIHDAPPRGLGLDCHYESVEPVKP